MKKYIYSPDENRIKQISVFRISNQYKEEVYIREFDSSFLIEGNMKDAEINPNLLFSSYSECQHYEKNRLTDEMEELEKKNSEYVNLMNQYKDENEYPIPEFEIGSNEILIIFDSFNHEVYGITSDCKIYIILNQFPYFRMTGDDFYQKGSINSGIIMRYTSIKKEITDTGSEAITELKLEFPVRRIDIGHPKSMMDENNNYKLVFSMMKGNNMNMYITGFCIKSTN